MAFELIGEMVQRKFDPQDQQPVSKFANTTNTPGHSLQSYKRLLLQSTVLPGCLIVGNNNNDDS
jgi:hypothetical protein